MKVSEYVVMWRDEKNCLSGTDYIQALNPKQAVEFLIGADENIEVVTVAKVCKNWK